MSRLEEIQKRYLSNVYIGGRIAGKTVFANDMNYLIEQAKQNQRYKEALEHIKENSDDKVAVFISTKALAGDNNGKET